MIWASSVTCQPSASARSCAWRSGSRLNPCGVCTATSRARSGVSSTRPSGSTRLMVSLTARPGMTASRPWPRPSSTRAARAADAKGRAASCTSTVSQALPPAASRPSRPRRTESCLRAPPSTTAQGTPRDRAWSKADTAWRRDSPSPGGKTRTTPSSRLTRDRVRAEAHHSGSPDRVRSCLRAPPTAPARRVPEPAARTRAQGCAACAVTLSPNGTRGNAVRRPPWTIASRTISRVLSPLAGRPSFL